MCEQKDVDDGCGGDCGALDDSKALVKTTAVIVVTQRQSLVACGTEREIMKRHKLFSRKMDRNVADLDSRYLEERRIASPPPCY